MTPDRLKRTYGLLLGLLVGFVLPKSAKSDTATRRLAQDDEAIVSLGHVGAFALSIAAVIIAAVVALIILSTLFPTYGGAVKNLSNNVTTQDWGNSTANSLGPIFGLLIALGGLFAIVGLAFVAYQLGGHRGKA